MKKNILLAVCFLMPLATMAQNDTLGHERNITLSEAIVLAPYAVCGCCCGIE